MSTAQWTELQELLGAALERRDPERTAFLDQACAGRPALRRELAELLAAHERASPLDGSAAALLEPRLAQTLAPGLEVAGRYRILERLDQGGMGVVYQALDLKLERILALKFLSAHLLADPTAKERLRVEAQAAAALDHPNICTIHEIGESGDGQLFIAMAYYDGETLRARLDRGPLPPDQAFEFAGQVARGLDKAHERAVVHRDIKPANLMITTDGVLKILDFGIAKVRGTQISRPGELLGTAAYMSPEQLSGEPLDGRTDIWSLGVVLYEMLTGERPFHAPGHAAVIHAILNRTHDPARSIRPELPEAADRVLARMLAKSPADRCSAAELVQELELLGRTRARASGVDREERAEVLPEGERRRVTILASAIAGSEQSRDRFRTRAHATVHRYGGVVNHFEGDQLVALFGVPTTHEDDPLRAVRAAIELHRGAEGLRVHSAIHTGSVPVQPAGAALAYRLTGPEAGLATWLAGQTPDDQIWLTPECQRAVSRLVESEALPPVAPSSESAPLVPFRVIGTSGLRTRLEAAERVGLTTFSGRDRELGALRGLLDEAMAGEGRFVTVTGDAGLGKSRLLHELRHELERRWLTLLQGRCEPSETGVTYLPLVGALRDWLGSGPAVARLRELGPELEEFIPFYLHLLALPSPEYPVPRHLHGEQFRLALQEALAAFVTLAARNQPTALLLEDWHWADEASHGVLQQVAELVTGFPLLVVVTCRPGYVRSWGNPGHHLALSLDPLDAGSCGSMLRSILREAVVPPELVELIHGRAGGNPFFLEEITQALLEQGALVMEGGAAALTGNLESLGLPETVQGVIRARLDRLDRNTREVLRLASVIGREFTRGILEHLVDGARLPHALQALKTSGVIQQVRVVPEPAYRFKHVLTQEAASASLLDHQRKELHGRVGEAIEALYQGRLDEQLGRLVEHFSRAEHWPKAVHYALRAAERANALSQFAESLETLERAQGWLVRLADAHERHDLLVNILFQQERLCETLGLRRQQERIVDELVALLEPANDPARLAEAYLRAGDLGTLLRRFEEAEASLDRALRLRRQLGDAVGERNTLRSLGLLRWHQGRDGDALRCIEAALAIDQERHDLEAQVGDLSNLGNVLKGIGQPERARIALEKALRLSVQLESATDGIPAADLSFKRAYILHNLANVHRELGDGATALEYLAQARAMTAEKRLPAQLSYHYTSTAHIYLQLGRVEESLALYREAVELTRRAKFVPGLAQALRFLGEVLTGLGREEEALAPLVEAAGLFAQLGDPGTEAALWAAVARLQDGRAEQHDALASWGKARALYRQARDEPRELEVLEGLARAAQRSLPDPSLALGYYGEALSLAERLPDRRATGRLRNAMGIIEWERGRYDEARVHYEAGLRVFRELEDSSSAALMLASLGVTLSAIGRWVEARRCLEEARALYRAAGDRAAEARALGGLTDVLIRLGDIEGGIESAEAGLRLRRECGDRPGEGWMLRRLALAHAADGSIDRARELAAEAARIALETGDADLAAACQDLPRAFGR